ncbi:MAG: VOC family protein [Vagococcus sp.]|uniref:VOC family protein n=1 Tax=Vagococcus sp. TaxID=1933889 RepID=UPI002FC90F32
MKKLSEFKIGHVLIKVLDLKTAVGDFENLGFTVTMGGLPDKATNAMIYFKEGSFIELYTVPLEGTKKKIALACLNIIKFFSPAKANRYINYLATKEGMNDFALDYVKDVPFTSIIDSLIQCDFPVTKAIPMKRIDAKNCQRTWQMSFSKDSRLPFFMDQYVPKLELEESQITHKNGATSLSELTISVDDYSYFITNYKKLTPDYIVEPSRSTFNFGDFSVVIEKGNKFAMNLLTLNGTTSKSFPSKATHGANIKIEKV